MRPDPLPLPDEVAAFITLLTGRIGGHRRVRDEVRRELESHFEDALYGLSPEEIPRRASKMVAEFGDPRLVGSLIRRAKRRCRSPLERFFAASAKTAVGAAILMIAAALILGRIAEREFQEGMAALGQKGLVSDCSQLKSPRPAGTVYYSGPANESAAAFLLGLNDQHPKELSDSSDLLDQLESSRGDCPADLPRMRELAVSLRPLLETAREKALLPPTPMEQIVSLTQLEGPPNQVKGVGLPAMDLVRLILLDAWVQYKDGRMAEAVKSGETALLITEHLHDFPQLISQVIATSAESSAFRLFGWMRDPNPFADADTVRLIEPHADRAAHERAAMAQSLKMESMNGRKLFHSGKEVLGGAIGNREMPFHQRAANWYLTHLYFTPLFRFLSAPDELGYFARWCAAAQCFEGPYFAMQKQRGSMPPLKEIPQTKMLTRFIATGITPSFTVDQAVCEARATLLRTAIQVERYRSDHGQYPPNLAALPTQPQPDFYTDPFTGRPLEYSVSGDTFELSSLGWEQQDPAGAARRERIVWGG